MVDGWMLSLNHGLSSMVSVTIDLTLINEMGCNTGPSDYWVELS